MKPRIRKQDINKQDLEYLVNERNLTNNELGNIFDCSSSFISDCVKYYNIKRNVSGIIKKQYRMGRIPNCKIVDIPSKSDILYMYNERKMSLNKLSKVFETSIPTLKKWMVSYGIEVNGISKSLIKLQETEFENCFYSKDFQSKCQSKRNKYNKSKPEYEIIEYLAEYYDGEIIHSYKIENKSIDIYIPELRVAIEYNGLWWHCEINQKNKNYHKEKTDLCIENGIRLIHIWEDDWKLHNARVKSWLIGILMMSNPKKIYARNTKCIEVSPNYTKLLFDNYHIQGFSASSKCMILSYDNEIVSSCLFKRQGISWNLTRYITHPDYMVIGGFARLIKNFSRLYPGNVYTFADLSWVSPIDNVYLRNGFKQDKYILPDYKYLLQNKRNHKFGFRHKQLRTKLEKYDSSITEYQNCFNNGIYRIWDCGKIRYIINHN